MDLFNLVASISNASAAAHRAAAPAALLPVDELGLITEQIKVLEERAKALKAEIATTEGTHLGTIYAATVTLSERATVNAKKLAAVCHATDEQIAAATSTAAVITVKTARLAH